MMAVMRSSTGMGRSTAQRSKQLREKQEADREDGGRRNSLTETEGSDESECAVPDSNANANNKSFAMPVSPQFQASVEEAMYVPKNEDKGPRSVRFMKKVLEILDTESLQDDIRVENVERMYKQHRRRIAAGVSAVGEANWHWYDDLRNLALEKARAKEPAKGYRQSSLESLGDSSYTGAGGGIGHLERKRSKSSRLSQNAKLLVNVLRPNQSPSPSEVQHGGSSDLLAGKGRAASSAGTPSPAATPGTPAVGLSPPGESTQASPSQEREREAAAPFTVNSWLQRCFFLTRLRLWLLMSDPDSSTPAYMMSIMILTVIVLSSLTFCMESMEVTFGDAASKRAFHHVEILSVSIFTAEYLLKILSAAQTWAFVKAPMNLVDFITVAPFYLELLMSKVGGAAGLDVDVRILRVLRLVRVFRVVKLGGRYGKLQVVTKAIQESMDMLAMMLFLLALSIIIFSSLIFFAERGIYDSELDRHVRFGEWKLEDDGGLIESPFKSIPASFWWCIVTLMTVGYGDIFPITPQGKVVAGCAMVVSVLIMALPISVIGTHFGNQWIEYKDRERYKDNARLAPSLISVCNAFKEHFFLMEDLFEKYTNAEDPVLQPLMKLEERLQKQRRSRTFNTLGLSKRAPEEDPTPVKPQGKLLSKATLVATSAYTFSETTKRGLNTASLLRERENMENLRLLQEIAGFQKVMEEMTVLLNVLWGEDIKSLLERTLDNYAGLDIISSDNQVFVGEVHDLKDKYMRYRALIFDDESLAKDEAEDVGLLGSTARMLTRMKTKVENVVGEGGNTGGGNGGGNYTKSPPRSRSTSIIQLTGSALKSAFQSTPSQSRPNQVTPSEDDPEVTPRRDLSKKFSAIEESSDLQQPS